MAPIPTTHSQDCEDEMTVVSTFDWSRSWLAVGTWYVNLPISNCNPVRLGVGGFEEANELCRK
jgi:hypothetical protein